MPARLILDKEREEDGSGTVKPLLMANGNIYHGLSVGTWHIGDNGKVYIDLISDLDTIVHEIATRKAVRAELRAAEKDIAGTEIKPTITLDSKTKRFKQVYPTKEA